MHSIQLIPDAGGPSSTSQTCGSVDVNQAVDNVIDSYGRGEATRVLLDELANCCSPEDAQAILDELQRREPEDWTSIVNTGAISELEGSGYPASGLTLLGDAIAAKHAEGSLSGDELFGVFGMGLASFGPAEERGAQMLFGASNSQAMQDFEDAMAGMAMDILAGADRYSASHGTDSTVTGWANNVIAGLGGDALSRQALYSAYSSPDRTAVERQHIRELLADKDAVGYAAGSPDALGGLIIAVAESGSGGTGLAVEMANWAGDNPAYFAENDVFSQRISDPRTEALSRLLISHSDAIFNDLTDGYENAGQYAADDSRRLGFLLGVTAFNPDNLFGEAVAAKLDAYTQTQADVVGADPESVDAQAALGRLEILSPSLLIAQALPFLGNLESNEARVDGILRILDTVVTVGSLVPAGRFGDFLFDLYGTVEGLSDSQIESGLQDYLTQVMSGSPEEIEAGLQELATMVDEGIQAEYGDNPVVAGAMSRRVEDTLYDMLLAISHNDVAGYLETHQDG
ncbi:MULTISPECIES: hypothetical protein [Luteimonas]|uniref:hypothetical protein n=1 Tax=Luteimonas TaxID=83614 RepID=UPI000C79B3C2|nr:MULTISPECIES: hypothetical protein [Luteimonas]